MWPTSNTLPWVRYPGNGQWVSWTSNFDTRILNPFLMDPDHVEIIGKWRQSVAKLFLAYWSMTRPRAKMTLGFGRTIQLVSI